MRLLLLVDRVAAERQDALGLVAELAHRHECALVAGRRAPDVAAPCATFVLEGLAAVGVVDLEPRLDELVASFSPEVVHLHGVSGEAALAWAGRRRALVTIVDPRPFHPERAVGRPTVRRARPPSDDPAAPAVLCADCFDTSPYFRALAAAAARRRGLLERAGGLVVERPELAAELAGIGVQAPIAIAPAGELAERAAWYERRYAALVG